MTTRGSTTQQSSDVSDPHSLYETARRFDLAANVLMERDLRTHQAPIELAAPIVVCRAFALEVILKCLLLLEGVAIPRSHHHRELFDALLAASQRAIEAEFDKLVMEDAVSRRMKEELGANIDLSLRGTLTACGRSFETWRYMYEGQACSAYNLREALLATRARIRNLRPSWT